MSDKIAAASEDVDEVMNRGAISKAHEITDEEVGDVKDESILEDESNAKAEESYKKATDGLEVGANEVKQVKRKKKKRKEKVLQDEACASAEISKEENVETVAENKDIEKPASKNIYAEEYLNRPTEMSYEGNVAENWDIFKEELEYYMGALLTGPQNDKEACDLMLELIGKEGRKIYKAFTWKKNEKKTMDAVIRKFNEAFNQDEQISEKAKKKNCNNI